MTRLNLADHDIESSARAGLEALKIARTMHSQMEEENARSLYYELNMHSINTTRIVTRGHNALKYMLFIGEMLIDFIPDSTRPGDNPCYRPHAGGAVANAAVALARLGGAARFAGKLAQDNFGRLLLQVLQANQVDTRFVPITSEGNTTLALVTLQEDGQREFTFYRQRTADTLLEPDELDTRAWQDVALCHAGSVLLATEPARSATLAAMEQAHRRGLTVSFDVNARPALWSSEAELREQLDRAITHTDVLKFSAEEAHYLDPALNNSLDPADTEGLQELAQKLLARGPVMVVITRGSLGAVLCTGRQMIAVPASTQRAIDTTGAGDAFMGAILFWLSTRDRTDAS